MCGVAAIVCAAGRVSSATEADRARVLDRLRHRGPDGSGAWSGAGAQLLHTRLAIIDPTPAGAQPMATPDGRWVISYNGELYNDAEVRRELEREGVRLRTACDTETVLHALARWGVAAAARLEGMYALALWDTARRTLLLARDPMGIKPLHYAVLDGREIVVASEVKAVLEHPGVPRRPDLPAVSAYLTTIRATLDDRTVFEGVRAVRAGAWIEVDASGPSLALRESTPEAPRDAAATGLRGAVERAVRSHLRSDVPWCVLLSGGLDSTVVASVAARSSPGLRTYCAGATAEEVSEDFAYAREASAAIGTEHEEVVLTRDAFIEGWQWLVAHNGVPMSTPNEVAILAVARALRSRGHSVVLSGEGADELFGGYAVPLEGAAAWIAQTPGDADGGVFELLANGWVRPDGKAGVLREAVRRGSGEDAGLIAWMSAVYRGALESAREAHPEAAEAEQRLDAHLRVHQRVNMEGLLRRLDSSTMAASVEGRVPLADAVLASVARRLPMRERFVAGVAPGSSLTKVALRGAFAGDLPASIVRRAKASFPLPFRSWMAGLSGVLRTSAFAADVFEPAALERLSADPGGCWTEAWPVINVALWGECQWG